MKIQQQISDSPANDPSFKSFADLQDELSGFVTDPPSARFVAGVIVAKVLETARRDIIEAECLLTQINEQWVQEIAIGAFHNFIMDGGE